MANGDWGAGCKAVPLVINAHMENGRLTHVGLGYHVVSRSGQILSRDRGWTWHNNIEGRAASSPHIAALEAAFTAMLEDLVAQEGFAGVEHPPRNMQPLAPQHP
jgi:hypothetical protein